MIELVLNKKKIQVKRLSDLTVREFNTIMAKDEAVTFPEYLSYFCETDKDNLMAAEYVGKSLTSAHAQIFNVEVWEVIKDKKHTIDFDGSIRSMSDVSIDTFGKNYMIDLKRKTLGEVMNQYEFSVYVLACGLSSDPNGADVGEIYSGLMDMKWTNVLPQAFFLNKNIQRGRLKKIVFYLNYTLPLRRISLRIIFYLRKLRKLERNYLPLNSAEG